MLHSHRSHFPFALALLLAPVLQAQPGPDAVFRYLSREHRGLERVWAAHDRGDLPAARAELLRYFQRRTDRLGTDIYPSAKANPAVAQANARNRFSWKGTSRDFGGEIDWRAVGVDREWNYSLNRLLWFENFAAVYRDTRDEQIARAWKDQALSWVRMGDPGFPRTIDTGRRLENLASSYCVFVTQLRSPSIDPEVNAVLLASIYEQSEFLYHPDHWRRYSNWGTFECSGLARAAILFPEFSRSEFWVRESFFRMQVQMALSYTPDGMHVELSPSYHAGELQAWTEFAALARRNGVKNPWLTQSVQPTTALLLTPPGEALAYFVMPSGKFPRTGDTDDSDRTDVLGRMARTIGLPHLAYAASSGREGVPPPETSKAFPDAGLFVLRSGWGDANRPFVDQMFVLFDATVNRPWHAHRDALNLLFSANGRDLLVDAGRFTYNEGPERELFLRAASHNTVVIDGVDQTRYDPKPESWWKFSERFDCVSASRIQGAVAHRRTVCFVKPEYLLVVDHLSGPGSYRQYWHLDAAATGQVKIDGQSALTPDLLISTSAERFELGAADISPRYRERSVAPLLTCSWSGASESSVATLLLPRRGISAARMRDITPPAVRGSHCVVEIARDSVRDLLLIRNPAATGPAILTVAGVETDAEVLHLRREGKSPRVTALRCSALTIDGVVYYQGPGKIVDLSCEDVPGRSKIRQ